MWFAQTAQNKLYKLLRWSERYTKTDMVYLASGSFWLTLGQILSGLIALGVSVAFAHFVPKETYGMYRVLLSLFWAMTAFSFTGISTIVTRAVARGEENAYRKSFRLTLLGSIPMIIGSTGLALYHFIHNNHVLAYGALLIGLFGPLYLLGSTYASILEGKKDFRRMSLFALLISIVPAAGLLIAMQFTNNPLAFFLIYLGGNSVMGLLVVILTFYIYKPNHTDSKNLVKLSSHYSFLNILSLLSSQADQLLIFHYLGTAQLALYTFAVAMPSQLKIIINNIPNLAFPKLVQKKPEEIKKNLTRKIFLIALLITILVIIYIIIAPFLFHLLLPTYSGAIMYSRLYALTLIPTAAIIPESILQARIAKRAMYVSNIISPSFQILILFVLISQFGIVGAITARFIGRLFNLILGTTLTYKHLDSEISSTDTLPK